MNPTVTSKGSILAVCREMVSQKGLSALNMRSVAGECHVALGSLYNYFTDKDDLVTETIVSVWKDIFHMDRPCNKEASFDKYVEWVFERIRRGTQEYPHFFTAHSISFASAGKSAAKEIMERYLSHIKKGMGQALHADASVRKDAFSPSFCEADFIDFILNGILLLLMRQQEDCHILLEMIRRTLYKER